MNLFLILISIRTFDTVLSLLASCLYSSIVVLITDLVDSKFTVNYFSTFFDFERNPSGKIVLSIIRANKIPTKLYLHSNDWLLIGSSSFGLHKPEVRLGQPKKQWPLCFYCTKVNITVLLSQIIATISRLPACTCKHPNRTNITSSKSSRSNSVPEPMFTGWKPWWPWTFGEISVTEVLRDYYWNVDSVMVLYHR